MPRRPPAAQRELYLHFTHAVPAKATGTYAIGVEARRTTQVFRPTPEARKASTYGAPNVVKYFSVDGSTVAPRRAVVALANCNHCHVALQLHGTLRNNTEYCVLCHNPSNTDASTRATATVAADKAAPPQGINFNLLVHRIHYGVNMQAANRTYIVVGFGGSHNDFSSTLFPALSPTGAATDTENCSLCHVNSTEQNDLTLTGLNQVTDPQGPINPVQPFSSACSGCHVDYRGGSHRFRTPRCWAKPARLPCLRRCLCGRPGACAVLDLQRLHSWRFCSWRLAQAAAQPALRRRRSVRLRRDRKPAQVCHEDIYQGVRRRVRTTRWRRTTRSADSRDAPANPATARRRSTPNRRDAADIRNPAKLAAAAADKICLTCHLNQPTHVGRLQSSHAEGSGRLHHLP